jgi:hypothetical protein
MEVTRTAITLHNVRNTNQGYSRDDEVPSTEFSYISAEVFTGVNMKKPVFWDIKSQFKPHRRHTTSPLQSTAG